MRSADAKEVRITTQVSKECWKQLKILAVQKEVSLQLVTQEVLEKAMNKKKSVETIDKE